MLLLQLFVLLLPVLLEVIEVLHGFGKLRLFPEPLLVLLSQLLLFFFVAFAQLLRFVSSLRHWLCLEVSLPVVSFFLSHRRRWNDLGKVEGRRLCWRFPDLLSWLGGMIGWLGNGNRFDSWQLLSCLSRVLWRRSCCWLFVLVKLGLVRHSEPRLHPILEQFVHFKKFFIYFFVFLGTILVNWVAFTFLTIPNDPWNQVLQIVYVWSVRL